MNFKKKGCNTCTDCSIWKAILQFSIASEASLLPLNESNLALVSFFSDFKSRTQILNSQKLTAGLTCYFHCSLET